MGVIFSRIWFWLALAAVFFMAGCSDVRKTPPKPEVRYPAGYGNSKAALDAMKLRGQPYVWGGASPEEGFDCSGLVVYVYQRQGLNLPRSSRALAERLPGVRSDQRQPGDLLFFYTDKPFSHVGIYVGNDEFVHAPSSRSGRVMLSSLSHPYWRARFVGVRRPQAASLPLSQAEPADNIR